MNPAPRAVVVKSQDLIHPAAVRSGCPLGQPTQLANRFVLINQLLFKRIAAHELLGQFAQRGNFSKSYGIERLTASLFWIFLPRQGENLR
jgi:hypothetical protein